MAEPIRPAPNTPKGPSAKAWADRLLSLAEEPFGGGLCGSGGLLENSQGRADALAETLRRPMRFALPLAEWVLTDPPMAGPVGESRAAAEHTHWWAGLLGRGPIPQFAGDGPILPEDPDEAIEVWSEQELSALHAAWWIARSNNDLRERLDAAVRWHTANLQPDNATNHPWAVHVFAEFAVRTGDAHARLHAETICSNYRVLQAQAARPDAERSEDRADLFSALIMLDASRAMAFAAR